MVDDYVESREREDRQGRTSDGMLRQTKGLDFSATPASIGPRPTAAATCSPCHRDPLPHRG